MAKASPEAWAIYASEGEWQSAHHLRVLIDYLMRVYRGEIKRLAISFPPGHSKSETVTKYFATWWLGRRPNDRVALAAYGQLLSTQWGKATKNLMVAHGADVFGTTTFSRSAAREWFPHDAKTRKQFRRGFLFSTSVGGVFTGKRGELIICDDILKGAAEANNKTIRDNVWTWFQGEVLSRTLPHSAVIMIGTRWHHDDPIGRVATLEGGEPWTILNFPAICTGDDPTRREIGEALWPEMFPIDFLERQRAEVGTYIWQALYQGNPTAEDGTLFRRKWFKYFTRDGADILSDFGRVPSDSLPRLAAVDLSVSTKDTGDYSVIAIFALDLTKRVMYLEDIIRFRAEGPDIVPKLWEAQKRYKCRAIYIEKIGFQTALLQEAVRSGLPARPVLPDRDKFTRALPAAAAVENGRILFPAGAKWLPQFEHELLTFPHGVHEDQVDALAYGVRKCAELWAMATRRRQDDGLGNRIVV
jgi:predicted phage terminase large subunit-like protein